MNPAQAPMTEDDIADFLLTTPDFFERHAQLLATVQLFSGYGDRVISLQERQAALLREKIKGLESHVAQMIRHSQDNLVIAGKLQSWTRSLLQTAQAGELPGVIVQGQSANFRFRKPPSRCGVSVMRMPMRPLPAMPAAMCRLLPPL